MRHHSLFSRSRFQLTIAYAGTMGAILLLCGYAAHIVIAQAFSRSIDRELELFARAFEDKLNTQLKTPGEHSVNFQKALPELCFAQQRCSTVPSTSGLLVLLDQGYYLRLLAPSGASIAAVNESPDRFPPNSTLDHSYDALDPNGELYHLHLMPLKTSTGQLWGYLQVGRSAQRLNDYMTSLHWLMRLGVPLAMGVIAGVGWWMAGLSMRPIQQSYEQIQQFTTDAAHELRTPIATIQIIVETALENPSFKDSASQHLLQSVYRQVKRLGELTQDLLLLSRLERRSQPIKSAQICLNDLVHDVEEELLPVAIAAQISLSSQIQTKAALYIQGNESQVYRLLMNLVSNGIQYTPANGAVTIVLKAEYNQAVIAVQDTGIGIASSDIPHIFDRFYRLESDRSRSTGGSGLGLAIALKIAQAHQGRLHVQSNLNQGSNFTVTLPLASIASKSPQ
jgi:signal transduction histidine kinase